MPTKSDIEQAAKIFRAAHDVITTAKRRDSTNLYFNSFEIDQVNRAAITLARMIRRNQQTRTAIKDMTLPPILDKQRKTILSNYRSMAKLKPEELVPEPKETIEPLDHVECVMKPVYQMSRNDDQVWEVLTLWGILAIRMEIEVGV